jgi:hypothetical protein
LRRENPIDGVLDLTYAVDAYVNGELMEVELVPGGAELPVTDANKADYVRYGLRAGHAIHYEAVCLI